MDGKLAAAVIVVVLVLVVAVNACFMVSPATHVLLFRFGRIVGSDFAPGLHFKIPFAESVEYYDGRILTLDNQTQTFTTSDQKNLDIAYYAKWKIADAQTYYRATGGQELVAMDRLSAILGRGLSDEFSKASEQQVVASAGHSLLDGLGEDTRGRVAALGIALVDLRIGNIDLPKDVLENVYARMRSERKRIASDLRAKASQQADATRADADARAAQVLADAHLKAEQIRGEGDARVAQIYAAAYAKDPEFLRFYRSLQAYRDALAHDHNVLVLSPDSAFFRYFNSPKAAK